MARKRKAPKRRPRKALPGVPTKAEAASSLANKLLKMLDQRTEQLGLINGVLRTIIAGASLPEILRVFGSNLKTLCPFDRCSIALYDEKERMFRVPWAIIDGRLTETSDAPRPYESTVLSKVIETRSPLLRKNLARDPLRFKNDAVFLQKGYGSELLFPLSVANRVFGTFNIVTFESDRLSERQMYLVQEVIPAVSVAVWQHVLAGRGP